MNNDKHDTDRDRNPEHATPCGALPFCGLGDVKCLTSRLLTCGLALVEQPLSAGNGPLGGEIRS